MKILLMSTEGIGAWFLLRLMREGHDCDWCLIEDKPRRDRVLRGLLPPPIARPRFSKYDLVIFDSSGHGPLADEVRRHAPTIGDSGAGSRLEDDRLYGIEAMEEAGIEVPPYEVFSSPDEARPFIEETGKRYVFKPFEVKGEEQNKECTYVSESAEDMLKCIDKLWEESHQAQFLLQEVVEGVEIATNGYFDGHSFHFLSHTLEEKKFMSGGYGQNTGCSGNLIYAPNGPTRLASAGLLKAIPLLRSIGYVGPIDLNTIVNEQHVYGLEWTPRFGYDATATECSLLDGNLGDFLLNIALGVEADPTPPLRARFSASERLTAPPYPEEDEHAHFDRKLPIKGISEEDAWLNCYMWDVQMGQDGMETIGINGIVAAPIGYGHTPEGAWKAVDRVAKKIKFPNLQCRDDMDRTTQKRLKEVMEMGWLV